MPVPGQTSVSDERDSDQPASLFSGHPFRPPPAELGRPTRYAPDDRARRETFPIFEWIDAHNSTHTLVRRSFRGSSVLVSPLVSPFRSFTWQLLPPRLVLIIPRITARLSAAAENFFRDNFRVRISPGWRWLILWKFIYFWLFNLFPNVRKPFQWWISCQLPGSNWSLFAMRESHLRKPYLYARVYGKWLFQWFMLYD